MWPTTEPKSPAVLLQRLNSARLFPLACFSCLFNLNPGPDVERNGQTPFTSLLATANMTEVEDARMQDLLTKWKVENNYEDDPEASDDGEEDLTYDTMLEEFRRPSM